MESEIFTLFVSYIHQDFLIDYPDFYPGISEILGYMSQEERSSLIGFINNLEEAELTDKELADLWNNQNSGVIITQQDATAFFEKLIQQIRLSS